MDLFEIVQHAEHQPLAVDLGSASEGETVQADGVANIGEDRLDRAQSSAVNEATDRRIDLAFHLFGEGVLAFFRSAVEVGDLPDFSLFRFLQTL